jgi:hypothetical protein
MGDPVGAAAHVRQSLAKDGTWMIVEPFANDQLKDNLNPVGRVYYGFSTLLCTPLKITGNGPAWVRRRARHALRVVRWLPLRASETFNMVTSWP